MCGICGISDELFSVLLDLDVVMFQSAWYENSHNAILEALAHHTPVIALRSGESSELVKNGVDGLLFEAGSAVDLAGRIKMLLVDRNLLSVLRAGIKPLKSVAEEMDELIQTYREVACEPSS